ncbi:hypothetical protein BC332_21248 [Capsicum chinense]|nr:hypothetical protein BC332_21248 [Capsicum chinense]
MKSYAVMNLGTKALLKSLPKVRGKVFPFGDKRKASLSHHLKGRGIPTLVALGPSGKIVTTGVRNLIMCHGAKAFPFTKKRMKEINAETAEMVKGWPKKIKHELLSKRLGYNCDGCSQVGQIWSFYCEECDFDLDPKCTLEEKKESNINPKKDQKVQGTVEQKTNGGWTCDDEVCLEGYYFMVWWF